MMLNILSRILLRERTTAGLQQARDFTFVHQLRCCNKRETLHLCTSCDLATSERLYIYA